MKISLFILSALLSSAVDAALRKPAGGKSARRLELEAMDHRELLEQPECAPHLNLLGKEMATLVHEGDGPLTNFLCNKIGRKDNKRAQKKMKEEVNSRRYLQEGDNDGAPCVWAIEKLLLGGKAKKEVKKGTESMGSCKDELAEEIQVIHEGVPEVDQDRIRHLMETDPDHRELWGFFKKISSFVKKTASKVATVATSAWNRVKTQATGLLNKGIEKATQYGTQLVDKGIQYGTQKLDQGTTWVNNKISQYGGGGRLL